MTKKLTAHDRNLTRLKNESESCDLSDSSLAIKSNLNNLNFTKV